MYGLQCSVLTICGSAMRQVTCQQWARTWWAWWAWWAWLAWWGVRTKWSQMGYMEPNRADAKPKRKQRRSKTETQKRGNRQFAAKSDSQQKSIQKRPRTGDANRAKESPNPCSCCEGEDAETDHWVAWQVTRAEALRRHCGLRHLLLRGVGSGEHLDTTAVHSTEASRHHALHLATVLISPFLEAAGDVMHAPSEISPAASAECAPPPQRMFEDKMAQPSSP